MIEGLFFIPVGPNDSSRVLWTVQSIRMHCKDYRIHLLLDGPDVSTLPSELVGSDIEAHVESPPTKANGGKMWLMYCLAMSRTLQDPAVSPKAIYVKMDADALVVRTGMIERAQEIFATRRAAGQIGQCFCNIYGAALSNFGWANLINKLQVGAGPIDF